MCLQLDEHVEGKVCLYHREDVKKRPIMLVAKKQLAMGCKLLTMFCLDWFRPVWPGLDMFIPVQTCGVMYFIVLKII